MDGGFRCLIDLFHSMPLKHNFQLRFKLVCECYLIFGGFSTKSNLMIQMNLMEIHNFFPALSEMTWYVILIWIPFSHNHHDGVQHMYAILMPNDSNGTSCTAIKSNRFQSLYGMYNCENVADKNIQLYYIELLFESKTSIK